MQALLQAAAEPKKSPGAPVFTLMARAGASPGPPSRQTSGQFAAEHGIGRPDSDRHAEYMGYSTYLFRIGSMQ